MTRRAEASKKCTEPASRIPHPAPGSLYPASREEPAFGGAQSDEVYSTQMQARLRQIEATNRQAAKLQEQATKATKASKDASSSSQQPHPKLSTSHSQLARGSVRSTLRDPAAARAAFIYGEVLGPPISQRKSNPVPGLS